MKILGPVCRMGIGRVAHWNWRQTWRAIAMNRQELCVPQIAMKINILRINTKKPGRDNCILGLICGHQSRTAFTRPFSVASTVIVQHLESFANLSLLSRPGEKLVGPKQRPGGMATAIHHLHHHRRRPLRQRPCPNAAGKPSKYRLHLFPLQPLFP
jgi:hypothetical protein